MVSFAVQKPLHLIRFHLFIFAFVSCLRQAKKYIATIYVKECSVYIFSKEF